jgi:large subunit ribosomal protein L15
MSLLHSLRAITDRSAKRLGRGGGSGKGFHTSSNGQKGQNSRNGGARPLWFEGGQLPLIKRMPMWRGKSRLKVLNPAAELTLTEISNLKVSDITLDTLKLEKVIDSRFKKAKIINSGEITRAVKITGVGVSAGARKAIEKAGGSVYAENSDNEASA